MSHRSEGLSPEQWDTIAPVPVAQIYRTHTLARQPAGLDDVVGRRRDVVTGVA